MPESIGTAMPDPVLFFKRGLHLKCPECGKAPMFTPLREVRTLKDWVVPLEGCPHCNYKYEREQGYFLISIWAINYGVVGGLGLGALFLLDELFHLPQWQTIALVVPFLPVLNFLFIRHAKSLFVAMDHYFDPHVKHS
jgi:uncharacterized protein (DUF983 family)